MGIDLTILASSFRERRGEVLTNASIRLDRDQRLLSLLSKDATPCLVSALPPGTKVGHYDDDGLKFDQNDRYGQPLTYSTPEQFRSLLSLNKTSEWNLAAITFASSLPPNTRIILYWC
ncbi:MAG TPA: hypothetical protein VFE62_18900 [Gemmataceae bacterium]|nr:hypothetical protein [Gemmataceae bacterium]